MITTAFTLIGRGNWTGGETYLRNMLGMIKSELGGRIAPKLFLSPEQAKKLNGSLDSFLVAPPIVDHMFSEAEQGKRLAKALMTGSDKAAEHLFKAEKADIVFESAGFYGRQFGIPVLSWIPDFQHRHLPHLFSKPQLWRRDIGFRAQTSTNRTIMLSSQNACDDCERFYPASRGKTAVVRFAIDFDPAKHINRREEIASKYELPARFYYLPNQFWKHKNHSVVIDALTLLKDQKKLHDVPPIVLTGRTDDPRNPTHFEDMMRAVHANGISTYFRYLGLIPYEDVFGLAGSCDLFINPSLFEGWSTTVEEAKGLGCKMLLSDIPIHREQAPNATFFEADSPKSLANALHALCQVDKPFRPQLAQLLSEQKHRQKSYADSFAAAVAKAIQCGAPLNGKKTA